MTQYSTIWSTEPEINASESARPESDYSRPTKRDPRGMRTGYTTGTTAAAAAKAAVILMLSGKAPEQVSVPLPGGRGYATLKVHNSWRDGTLRRASVARSSRTAATTLTLPTAPRSSSACGGCPTATRDCRSRAAPALGTVTRPGTGIEVG